MVRVEEIWIIRLQGDLLYRHPERPDPEADYLARRLVETHRFVRDSFAQAGAPRVAELAFGDRQVALVAGHFLVLAAFVGGRVTRRLRSRLVEVLQSVELAWEDSLADWHPGQVLPDVSMFLYALTGGSSP